MATFGEKLKAIRKHLHISQEEFGDLLGNVKKQAISRYENDLTSPLLSTAADFAQKLDMDLIYLTDPEYSCEDAINALGSRGKSIDETSDVSFSSERAFLFSKIKEADEDDIKKMAQLWKIIEKEDQENY